MTAVNVITIGDLARRVGRPVWMVRRVFERGLLPPAPRVGPYRVVTEADVPRIIAAMRTAGYLDDGYPPTGS